MGSKTRLSCYCTKRANNGVNLVTSRKINTRLACPIRAFPHRQFQTLPGLLDSWAALPNFNPNACMPMQGGSLYHFYDGLWYELTTYRARGGHATD